MGTKTSWACGDFCCATTCPRCGAIVFFVRHNGGSVWFDQLGKPWPKHSCFFDDLGGARLRVKLAEPFEGGTRFFGVVSATEVTDPGERGRIVVQCSDGRTIDDEFATTLDLTRFPGALVVIDETEPGRYVLDQVVAGAAVVEVYDCPKLGQPVVFDPRRQQGVSRLDTRVWMCHDQRWASYRTFHFWRLVTPIDGLTAARLAVEYDQTAPEPKNDAGAELFDAILRGRMPPKAIEVVVFAGTAYERRFNLPATLSGQQVFDWVREVESTLGPHPIRSDDGKIDESDESGRSPASE